MNYKTNYQLRTTNSFLKKQSQFLEYSNEHKSYYDKALRQFPPPRTLQKQSQNKPNSNPIKPNFRNAKMNLKFYSTKDYENEPRLRTLAKQTQNKPNQTQFLPRTFSPAACRPGWPKQ